MRTWSIAVVAAGLVTSFATAAHAQAPINPLLPTQGTREISASGNLQFSPYQNYNVNLGYGPFLSRKLQVGAQLGFDRSVIHSNTSTTFSIGPFVNYYFPGTSATEPYVGAFIGYSSNKDSGTSSTNTTSYGLQVGVKHFLNSNVAAFAELPYRHYDKKVYDNKHDTVGLDFGLAFYLK